MAVQAGMEVADLAGKCHSLRAPWIMALSKDRLRDIMEANLCQWVELLQ